EQDLLYLDNEYAIRPDSWVVIQKPDENTPRIFQPANVATPSIAAYGLSGKTTRLELETQWLDSFPNRDELRENPNAPGEKFDSVRGTVVHAQSVEQKLAESPIKDVIGRRLEDSLEDTIEAVDRIELDRLYDGLESGRWLIVAGERADVAGVQSSELVMLAAVEQSFRTDVPGEMPHTVLVLAVPLEYSYIRSTVTIYGNVAQATHGETRAEVMGSGDGRKAFQQFVLKQPPLTYLPAPTAIGAASTLEVRVNEVLWHETDSLVGLAPSDRAYTLTTDDDSNTTVIFGNGITGARLPSGRENVRAVYRSGIGKAGNVAEEQISILATRPAGLKGVINPLPATGGANRESPDTLRRNIPLAVMSLDRLVSTQDYADFARTFAGIGKASAQELSNGHQTVVHVTIAGAEDIPIDESSDLYRHLLQALQQQGDPYQPIQLVLRELMVLFLVASVKVLPDYRWELVEPKVRAKLLETFSFEHRELGQSVALSEMISAMQQVPGVDFVDVDIFDRISESEAMMITADEPDQATLSKKLEKIAAGLYVDDVTGEAQSQPRPQVQVNLARRIHPSGVRPAQIAIFSPEIADTLILQEWKA
ncbi:MAG: putative baseplate assembly protein, partial [Cyanobacteria bacterium P01_F01_bin.56]